VGLGLPRPSDRCQWSFRARSLIARTLGQDAAELGNDVEQASIEALEGIVWQIGEQPARESAVTVNECLGCGVSPCGEGDQCRAAVGGMRFTGDEPGVHQAVDQSSDGAGRDVQVSGQRGLGARSALLKLPHKVRPGFGQALAGEAVGHVPAEQHRQFEYPVQRCFPPLATHIVTLTHDELDSLSAWLSPWSAEAHTRFQAFNAGDADECMALATPDLIINLAELPEPQRGREVWRQGFEMMKHAFPDLQAHIEDIFAAQDKVAVRLRFHGTHSGEFLGFPATGRTVDYVSHEFYRIADGLIAEEWICSDMATLLRQLS
jgi:steroid delta-isomerase-like uncharacterized protein